MRLSAILFFAALGSHAWTVSAAVEPHPAGTQIVRMDPGLDQLIEPGTPVERVATGFKFTEGPMWHAGRLWFSDLSGNKMYAVSADGEVKLLIDRSGGLDTVPPGSYLGSNAMAPDQDGSVLMVQQGGRKIVRVSKDLQISPFLDSYQHKKLNSP